ncbi:stalk domain-containing protein [Paenibacillus beijingensis]|uniref:stalk domain-containing protein n=1 Tax=Paenibacillus beijingensis TaxID=1126833 RepID=UPI00130D4BDD|nr:trypsin-like peptidase domain-containing protein [Paenibacillus beijingensis]
MTIDKRKPFYLLFGTFFVAWAVLFTLPGMIQPAAAAASPAIGKQTVQREISVAVDGMNVTLRRAPVIRKGSILVPMKDIFAALNAELIYAAKTKTITATDGYSTVTLQIGSSKAVVDGESVKLDVPAEAPSGVTMVPVRFVAEALEASVKWDAAARVVRITSADAIATAEAAAALKERESAKLSTREIVQQNDDSVVMIMTDNSQGSGVVIGDSYVLTNLHVMQDATSGTVITDNGTKLDIQGVAVYDDNSDLVLIKTKQPMSEPSVTLGTSYEVEKGDPVVTIGSPLGMQNTVSEGLISNIGTEEGVEYFQISAPIDHGSSGGGLFNEYGELIGITSSGVDDTSADLNYAVSVANIMSLLGEEFDESKVAFLAPSLPASLKGASNEDIVKLMKEQFGALQTSYGSLTFSDWTVTRDAKGWLVFNANLNADFYDYYETTVKEDFWMWAYNTASELSGMLPDETIQLAIYYDKTVGFEPRGYAEGEATATPDGKWRIRYAAADVQVKDDILIRMHN